MKTFKLGKSSTKHLKGVKNDLIVLIKRVLLKSKYDFGIPKYGGLRTTEEQNELFKSNTKKRKITSKDGYIKKSYHQTGNAFDIFLYKDGRACWDCIDRYKKTADLFFKEFDIMKDEGFFKEYTYIRWGGNWKSFKDYPHFEIR